MIVGAAHAEPPGEVAHEVEINAPVIADSSIKIINKCTSIVADAIVVDILRGSRIEALKVVSSCALLESSSNDAGLVLLVDAVCILELEHPLAGDELDVGRKNRDLDDKPAAHLLERMILKIQRSFPELSIRSVESVLILERPCVK
jgi:hypothetical protein